MMNELVSIIIPVYNSEKYVQECIDSFLCQTYSRLELLLIDDGSTDKSLDILLENEKKYPEIVSVYTQKNAGVAITRNRGIQYANGKYLMFADNDDYVEKDYVERMVQEIEQDSLDMVVCSCRKVDENHNILYEQILTDDAWSKFRMVAPWARIIRKDFVIDHKIEFGNFIVGEDSFFSVTSYNESARTKTIPYIGYNWVQHSTSVSNTVQKNAASPLPFLNALVEKNKEKKNITPEQFDYFVIKFIVWNLYYICDNVIAKERNQCCDEYFKWLNYKVPDYKKNNLISINKPIGEDRFIRIFVFIMTKSNYYERKIILSVVSVLKRFEKSVRGKLR